jgi:hypothetical protein
MAESILKIHTQNGDVPVGYPGLADKPIADKTLSVEGAFADSKAVGDKFKEVKTETNSLKEDLVNLENGTCILKGEFDVGNIKGSTGDMNVIIFIRYRINIPFPMIQI